MTKVVSVTMLAVERDSRTLREAASFARFGYESVVLEGEPSDFDHARLPFELRTVEGATGRYESDASTASNRDAATGGAAPGEEPAAEPPPASNNPLVRALPEPLSKPVRNFGAFLSRSRNERRKSLSRILVRSFREDNRRTHEALPDAELYYLHFFWQYPAVRRKCRETGAAYIYDAHDAYWDWNSFDWYPRPFSLLLRAVERRCVRGAAGFVSVSDGTAGLIERRYGRRPVVVRNFQDTRLDEPAPYAAREAAGLGSDDFLAVLVGNEKPGDAMEELLRALVELPDRVHVALLGRGYEKHGARARELDVAERVHLLPPVAPTQVTEAIRSADAGMILYRGREENYLHALPNRLFHSIAAGLPVLYPPLPEVRALAEAHGLGLAIETEDPASIAVALRRLSEEPELAAELRENVERARGTLSWEQEERLLEPVLKAALLASAAQGA